MATEAVETVLTFLGSIGRRSDAELYWKLFREQPRESFALIAAELEAMREGLDSFSEQVSFLARLGLSPALVLGLFRPERSHAIAARVAAALEAKDIRVRLHDASGPELARAIRADIQAGALPILTFRPGAGLDFRARFRLLASWLAELGTRKLVILRRRGGLGPRARGPLTLPDGHVLRSHAGGLSLVNLRTDLAGLTASGWLSATELELLARIRELAEETASSGARAAPLVSVASPLSLLQELFTVKGAGTLITLGAAIEHHAGYESLDRARLAALLEASFGRTLRPTFFARAPKSVYLEPSYRGAIILEPSEVAPYLTKFAVDRIAQGEGIGRDLWHAVCRDEPAFYWRAQRSNPITGWYTEVCDGMVRARDWLVFWRGVPPTAAGRVVELALGWPTDFEPPAARKSRPRA